MLSLNDIRDYCLKKEGKIEEDFPFDEETLVIKVRGKIFLLAGVLEQPVSMNLKCDPERAKELRAQYEEVKPGYHMNKKHWNTVTADGSIPDDEILRMIDHSYELVSAGLPKKRKGTKKTARRGSSKKS